jgi:hypothetical protein
VQFLNWEYINGIFVADMATMDRKGDFSAEKEHIFIVHTTSLNSDRKYLEKRKKGRGMEMRKKIESCCDRKCEY